MTFVVLSCPQCAAPLPREAYWRTVTCSYCGATVSRVAETVRRADFRAAFERVRVSTNIAPDEISISGERYAIHHPIAHGTHSEVSLARRLHLFPSWVTLKLSHSDTGTDADTLHGEAENLNELNALRTPSAGYFTQRLPQKLAFGRARSANAADRFGLVLRHPVGYWGTLLDAGPAVSDPRHIAWIWRRVLEVLAWIHDSGWTHDDLSARHLLLHPQNHGVLIIGWARAAKRADPAIDLSQLAWTMRQILGGSLDTQPASNQSSPPIPASLPAPIAQLVQRASEDVDWCRRTGARGLHEEIGRASAQAFGAPRFIPLILH